MLIKYRSKIVILLITIFLVTSIALALDYKYVGSKKSNKYHYPTCKWAKKISPDNLVTFASASDALAKGYVPCKVCKPPTKD